jgi:thioredoxin-related protein
LYNKKYNLIYKLEGKLSSHDNRPYQILVFKENIININVHFPHFTFYQEEAVKIIKVNVDQHQDLAGHFMVRGVPTFMLFKTGKMLWRQSGVLSAKDLTQIISSHMN